jgi:CMP-N-acetylneuraminic acid synthetase
MTACEILALILARGGSKGIKNKNLMVVGGEPLISRTVRAAKASMLRDVFVWSDDENIRSAAAELGGKTPVRSAELSADRTTTEEAVVGFIRQVDPKSRRWKAICVLQCTTPFLRSAHIDSAVRLCCEGGYDSAVSVVRFDRYLGYTPMPEEDSRRFVPLRPYRTRRQDGSPPYWMENGGIYLASRKIWESGRRIGLNCGVVPMKWWESVEIDEPIDLEAARRISELMGTS